MNLIMCEGPNERAVIEILLDSDKLIFTRDDVLGLRPLHARQIAGSAIVKNELNLYPGCVDVLRIGDTLTDRFQIPAEYADKVRAVRKYCTKPEIEMLLIITEGLEDEFKKVKAGKRKQSAKVFSKEHIFYGRKRYDNSTQFYYDYFGDRPDELVEAIIRYKKIHGAHKKGEDYLADLLK